MVDSTVVIHVHSRHWSALVDPLATQIGMLLVAVVILPLFTHIKYPFQDLFSTGIFGVPSIVADMSDLKPFPATAPSVPFWLFHDKYE